MAGISKDDYLNTPQMNRGSLAISNVNQKYPISTTDHNITLFTLNSSSKTVLQPGLNYSSNEFDDVYSITLTEDDSSSIKSKGITEESYEEKLQGLENLKNHSDPPVIKPLTRFSTWFTPYRKIFVLVVLTNLVGCFLEVIGLWRWAKDNLTLLVVWNVLNAILIRNEWFLRFLYWCSVKVFRPAIFPVWFRARVVGILYHIGGLHSGSGLSAFLWLLVSSCRHFSQIQRYHPIVLISLTTCLGCILLTCISAFPVFRGPHHNLFEIIHRFVGWFGILSTFLFIIVSSFWDSDRRRWDASTGRLVIHLELWFLVSIFLLIISSWITTAKVPVQIHTSSDKATVIRVPGGLTSGLHTRISKGGLQEWHIFGSISEGKHSDCHYIVAAVQGEFTRMLNVEKPQMLYTKTWKPCGLPYFSRMFHRGVAICTGSGIGAVGSTCIQHEDWFLVWIGPELEKTYGSQLMDLIRDRISPDRRIIWDTRSSLGRPDVVQLLQQVFKSWNAEVALFIGSPALNKQVLQSSKALKLPVFGSIWDA